MVFLPKTENKRKYQVGCFFCQASCMKLKYWTDKYSCVSKKNGPVIRNLL